MKPGDFVRIKKDAPVEQGIYRIKRMINDFNFTNILVLEGVTKHKNDLECDGSRLTEYYERCKFLGINIEKESGLMSEYVELDVKETRKNKIKSVWK